MYSVLFDIRDYGAVPGGTVLCTDAVQKAIDAAADVYGTVVVPDGRYLMGAVFLRDNMRLHIEKDGILIGSEDIVDYPIRNTRFEGRSCQWPVALINCDNTSGTVIDGEGTIDGNGHGFWEDFWNRRQLAVERNRAFSNRDVMRPRLCFINNCRNIHIQNIHLQNSAFWNVHIYNSESVTIDGISVLSPHEGIRAASSDAIDIDACANVTVRNCRIDTDDDCICIKGGKGADAHRINRPTENICIEHCSFGFGHGMVTIGSEAAIVRNVFVHDCTVDGQNTIVRFKFRDDTSQVFENILFDHIRATNGRWVFDIQNWNSRQDEILAEGLPTKLSNIIIRNIKADTMESPGIIGGGKFSGTAENIVLEDITITTVLTPFTEATTEGIDRSVVSSHKLRVSPDIPVVMKNVRINGDIIGKSRR